MEIYRKNHKIQTQEQAEALLDALDDLINNPEIGKVPPRADRQLLKICNNGERLDWEWEDEEQWEYDRRIATEQAETDLLNFYQNTEHLDVWKTRKVRPLRDQRLRLWIDETFIKPLLYNLTYEQEAERISKRIELLDWPDTFEEWESDEDVKAAMPTAPSWV